MSSKPIVSEGQIDKAALLRGARLFEGLSDDAIARLARLARVAAYPQGDETQPFQATRCPVGSKTGA